MRTVRGVKAPFAFYLYTENDMLPCNQCGKCCEIYQGGRNGGIYADSSDIERWANTRPDILQYVGEDYLLFTDPKTKQPLPECPFYKGETKKVCAIYEDRPNDCRVYPVNPRQAWEDGCEMIEAVDITWDT